jgi:hypothetical protein
MFDVGEYLPRLALQGLFHLHPPVSLSVQALPLTG